ncbi:hypothetical protein HQ531_12150 [bacterium]|nr:hypothetical protein [bacterium]
MNAQADDIRFKSGQILQNCVVVDTVGTRLRIESIDGFRTYPLHTIDSVIKSPVIETQPTVLIGVDSSLALNKKYERSETKQAIRSSMLAQNQFKNYKYPNAYLLPISAIGLGLAWDYFSEYGDIKKTIKDLKKDAKPLNIYVDTSDLEDQRTRKLVLGVTFLTAGVINSVFALQRVEVSATNNSIGLSYNF